MALQFLNTAVALSTIVLAAGEDAVILDSQVDRLVVPLEVGDTSKGLHAEHARDARCDRLRHEEAEIKGWSHHIAEHVDVGSWSHGWKHVAKHVDVGE